MRRHLDDPRSALQGPDAARPNGSRRDSVVATGRPDVRRLARARSLTVLVPTRNERGNIATLLDRLGAVSRAEPFAVLFVDDSTDGTPEVIRALSARTPFPVGVLHRPENERSGGLGGAVRAGLSATESELVCVMDADLQHPPELLPALVAEARRSNADVVVASRHRDGGDIAGFPAARRALSRGSELMARVLFPRRLRAVSDPMSGFFLVRRMAIDVGAMRPCGFKILLEILLSGPRLSMSEIGFQFGERYAGESKATLREGGRYLRRLIVLRVRRWNRAGKRGSTVSTSMPIGAVDANASY
jgi:glycosyltransferase involved in cell wall biosynthesis